MKNFLVIVFILLLLFNKCTPKKKTTSFSNDINYLLNKELITDGPGGAVLVMKDDSIIFSKGYGLADLKTKEAITTKTLFNLGSISKTFVAQGILLLQQQGKLSVEDSLYKYFLILKTTPSRKE